MNPLLIVPTAVAALGLVLATTFELLPERVDPLQFSLTFAGAGALVGTGYGTIRKAGATRRASYSERASLLGAALGLVIAVVGYVVQELL
ncbi:MAG: hypothetical protein M3433_02160 [Actinomycetota bacterium]|nr:hypothetical protein [Actinomycetota bacterium]